VRVRVQRGACLPWLFMPSTRYRTRAGRTLAAQSASQRVSFARMAFGPARGVWVPPDRFLHLRCRPAARKRPSLLRNKKLGHRTSPGLATVSDHCDFLTDSGDEQASLLAYVRQELARKSLGYIEVRPRFAEPPPASANSCLRPSDAFFLHTLSLDPPLDALFRNLHKDCIQRKVRRAERERLAYAKRVVLTRCCDNSISSCWRPADARAYLHSRSGGSDSSFLQWVIYLVIRVASKDGRPVAAIITLAFKTTLTYKYGCSDQRFHNLGGMPFLFWKTIQEAKDAGMHQLDLGRSEPGEIGLTTFKERLGAHRAALTYYRMSSRSSPQIVPSVLKCQILRRAISTMPDALLVAAGRLLYRHLG